MDFRAFSCRWATDSLVDIEQRRLKNKKNKILNLMTTLFDLCEVRYKISAHMQMSTQRNTARVLTKVWRIRYQHTCRWALSETPRVYLQKCDVRTVKSATVKSVHTSRNAAFLFCVTKFLPSPHVRPRQKTAQSVQRMDGPGDRIQLEARFSAPVQAGPGTHPTSCARGRGSLSRR
jgi:hypothetical protein